MRLSLPRDDAPAAQFLVNKLDAAECLSRDFLFKVELLADSVKLDLKTMQGKLPCRLHRPLDDGLSSTLRLA